MNQQPYPERANEKNPERREFEELLAYGHARMRERLLAQGLDADRMTEEEIEDYVNRAIHEYREKEQQ